MVERRMLIKKKGGLERKPTKPASEVIMSRALKHIEKLNSEAITRAPSSVVLDGYVNYSGKSLPAFNLNVGRIEVVYRLRDASSVEQRRYYLGHVQVAYVRMEAGKFHCIIINELHRHGTVGVAFQKESELHAFILEQLTTTPDLDASKKKKK